MPNVKKEFQPNRTGEYDFRHVSDAGKKFIRLKGERKERAEMPAGIRKDILPNGIYKDDFCHVSALSAKIAELKAETHLLQIISDRHRETKLPTLTAERMFYRDAPGNVMHYDNGNALRPCSCGYLPDKDRTVHTGEQIYCPVCNAKLEAIQIREPEPEYNESEYLTARREYMEAGGLKSISIKQFFN